MTQETVDDSFPSVEPSPTESTVEVSPAFWLIGLILAASVSWGMLHYWPFRFELPAELMGGTVANNPELSARAAELGAKNLFKNGLVSLIGVALAFGVIPVICCWGKGSGRLLPSLALAVLLGIGCGLCAKYAGDAVRVAFAPSEAEAELLEPSMLGDILSYAAMSALVVLPAAALFLLSASPRSRQKWIAVPLAGGLAGVLLPIIVPFAFPTLRTDTIPPKGMVLTALWLVMLVVLVFGLSVTTGSRERKA